MSEHSHEFSRRKFLQLSAGFAGAGLLSGCAAREKQTTLPDLSQQEIKPGYKPKVSSAWIPRGEHWNAYDLAKKTMEDATDFSWLAGGDRILLKLSLNSGKHFPATTDPWSLDCMIKILQEKGAGEILVGDQAGIEHVYRSESYARGSTEKCCESTGLMKVIRESGAEPVFFENETWGDYFRGAPRGDHHWKKPIMLPPILKTVDHIIYMPRVSSHVLGDITSGMKIGVGFLRDDSRVEFHRGGDHFYAMYEEINHVPEIADRLRLIVSSGRKVLTLLGPDDGAVSHPEHGLLFASEDLLAHEAMAYAWLQYNRANVPDTLYNSAIGGATRYRSTLNKGLITFFHDIADGLSTPPIPFFQPVDESIYNHPSIVSHMIHKGGRPEKVEWSQMNTIPDNRILDFMNEQIGSIRTS